MNLNRRRDRTLWQSGEWRLGCQRVHRTSRGGRREQTDRDRDREGRRAGDQHRSAFLSVKSESAVISNVDTRDDVLGFWLFLWVIPWRVKQSRAKPEPLCQSGEAPCRIIFLIVSGSRV